MPSIAGGMKRGSSLGDVLAHDRHLANLSITKAKLVVSKSDGARIVRALRLVEGLGQECDTARGFAARNRKTAMEPPKIRQSGGIEPLASFWGWPKCLGRTPHIVLKQPGFRQSTADLNLLVAVETRLAKAAD